MADTSSILKQAEQHLKGGKPEQARLVLQRALQKTPNDADLNSSMCFVLQQLGQHEQAMHFGKRALSARPGDMRFVENVANIFGMANRHAAAAEVLERVVAAEPQNSNAWNTLATAYFMAGRLGESENAARRGLAVHPLHPRLMEQHSAVARKLGRCAEAYAIVKEGSLANPEDDALAHETAFNSNYPSGIPPEEVFDAHKRFGTLWCAKVKRIALARPTSGEAERPLRIAFMSPDFRQHSVSHYAEPVIAGLDRTQFSVYIYFLHQKPDEVTDRFRRLTPYWCDAVKMSDDVLAQRIAFDKIDILIDLTGLTGGARAGVLARKPAHIQVNYLGYPNTVGIPTVDYRFIDSITDPPGTSDALAVEKLVRLDPCFLCYRPSAEAPEVNAPPMLAPGGGYVTFGSFNAGMKLSDVCVSMWSKVLHAVPGSRLFLKNFDLALPEPREHLYERFLKQGIERGRVEMQAFTATIPDHLRLYHKIDIGLDSFPYHGTTTTCEAFHMGIPVVSLEGNVHAARVGSSLLHAVGLPELIARSEEEFVKIAMGLAADSARLASIRASLRDRQSRGILGDQRALCDRFGAALRECWRGLCNAR